jgi:putative effector of murein hydrolase
MQTNPPLNNEHFSEQIASVINALMLDGFAYYTTSHITPAIIMTLLTILIYQLFANIQKKLGLVWFNPMLASIFFIIPALIFFNFTFDDYYQATQVLSWLLEPAIVALGFPLYQHLSAIKNQWKIITALLAVSVAIVIIVSFILTITIINLPEISVSLSLKSVTMPIGIALTEELNGNNAITAFAIILAGLFGAILGPRWLTFIGVRSAKAQGLAVGAASHALGTFTISKISYEHGAYASLALIISAVLTAIISPILITQLVNLFPLSY